MHPCPELRIGGQVSPPQEPSRTIWTQAARRQEPIVEERKASCFCLVVQRQRRNAWSPSIKLWSWALHSHFAPVPQMRVPAVPQSAMRDRETYPAIPDKQRVPRQQTRSNIRRQARWTKRRRVRQHRQKMHNVRCRASLPLPSNHGRLRLHPPGNHRRWRQARRSEPSPRQVKNQRRSQLVRPSPRPPETSLMKAASRRPLSRSDF